MKAGELRAEKGWVVAGVFYLPSWTSAVVKEESTAVASGNSRWRLCTDAGRYTVEVRTFRGWINGVIGYVWFALL